ncbi:MAG: VOC family protein, partial [Candidatus Krumholzibacteriota bacterium]|nr:VOC family protein [Candidatus Krumholzibacteriota bacterium]
MNRPELEGVLETALYVDDLERSVAFYKQLFVFELLFRSDRAVGFNVEGRQVLLLFPVPGKEPVLHGAPHHHHFL